MASWKVPEHYRSRPIAVLGGGVLGRRIAACWASGGYNVQVREPDAAQGVACVKYVEENASSYPAAKDHLHTVGKVTAHQDLPSAVKDAWLVVEAIPEKLPLKTATFGELETLAPKDAILASNSSSYKSSEMLGDVKEDATKTRIVNTHYYMPPQSMVVEIMTDGFTDPGVISFLVDRQKEVGTIPYVARKESTGLIFNRVWAAVKREVLSILAEGVSVPQEIDGIFTQLYGTKVGPCFMMDQVGLDTVAFIEDHYVKERGLSPEKTVDFLQKNYISKGKLGAKSAHGGLYPRVPKLLVLDIGLAGSLIGLNNGNVMEFSGDCTTSKILVPSQNLPDGIDVDVESGRMFWSLMGPPGRGMGAIMAADLDGKNVTAIVPQGTVNTPKQLTVEPASKKIYFCDREGLRIFRCNYDGSDLETLVQNGDWKTEGFGDTAKWCVGIAVAPKYGKFYWTQKGASKSGLGRIFMANIDGPASGKTDPLSRTDVQEFLDHLPEPIDIEVDEETDTIYWTDRGELPLGNTLNRAKLDPKTGELVHCEAGLPYEIIATHFNEAIGLKIDREARHIYVTDLGGSIYRLNMDGSEKKRIFYTDQRAFSGLTII